MLNGSAPVVKNGLGRKLQKRVFQLQNCGRNHFPIQSYFKLFQNSQNGQPASSSSSSSSSSPSLSSSSSSDGINEESFNSLLAKLGIDASPEESRSLFREANKSGSGLLSISELESAIQPCESDFSRWQKRLAGSATGRSGTARSSRSYVPSTLRSARPTARLSFTYRPETGRSVRGDEMMSYFKKRLGSFAKTFGLAKARKQLEKAFKYYDVYAEKEISANELSKVLSQFNFEHNQKHVSCLLDSFGNTRSDGNAFFSYPSFIEQVLSDIPDKEAEGEEGNGEAAGVDGVEEEDWDDALSLWSLATSRATSRQSFALNLGQVPGHRTISRHSTTRSSTSSSRSAAYLPKYVSRKERQLREQLDDEDIDNESWWQHQQGSPTSRTTSRPMTALSNASRVSVFDKSKDDFDLISLTSSVQHVIPEKGRDIFDEDKLERHNRTNWSYNNYGKTPDPALASVPTKDALMHSMAFVCKNPVVDTLSSPPDDVDSEVNHPERHNRTNWSFNNRVGLAKPLDVYRMNRGVPEDEWRRTKGLGWKSVPQNDRPRPSTANPSTVSSTARTWETVGSSYVTTFRSQTSLGSIDEKGPVDFGSRVQPDRTAVISAKCQTSRRELVVAMPKIVNMHSKAWYGETKQSVV